MKRALLAALTLLANVACGWMGSGGASDDRRILIEGPPTCPECEVVLREVAVLGRDGDPASARPNTAGYDCMVAPLSSGEYVVSGMVGGGALYIYTADGALARTVGRAGAGPGEFGRSLRVAAGRGDTLWVVDDGRGRVQVLTPAGEFVRSIPSLGRVRSFALLRDGSFLFHEWPAQPDDHLFQLVTPDGRARVRFGRPTMEEVDLDHWIVSATHAARSTSGFWTAGIWKYEAYRWSAVDSLARTVTRKVDWFPGNGIYPEDVFVKALPPPGLIHVWEDAQRRLWTYSIVPDPNWDPEVGTRPTPEWLRRTYDTVVEVLDLEAARVLATGRYPTKLGSVCGSHLMYTVIETDEGDTRVQVLEPTLIGSDGGTSTGAVRDSDSGEAEVPAFGRAIVSLTY